MRHHSPSLCFGLALAVLVALMGALPVYADQPDFDFKLDVQPPQNVGDQFIITVTVIQLTANASQNSTIRVIRPDGQVAYQPPPVGGGASVAGWQQKQTYQVTPSQNGEYTIQSLRVLGDVARVPYPPEALQVVAETQVSTDKAQPGLEKVPGQDDGVNAPNLHVNVSDLETSPAWPPAGQPTQVLVTLTNDSLYDTDAVALLSVTWGDGSASQPVGQVLFTALRPGEQRTIPFTWTPAQAVDGAELDARVGSSLDYKTWGSTVGIQQAAPEDPATNNGDGS